MRTPIIDGLSQAGLVAYLKARQYDQLYWPIFFPLKDVNTLDGRTLIGGVGSRVAAQVISYDTKAPEASRKVINTQFFDIPKIAISRRKTEKEIIEHKVTLVLQGQNAVIEDYFNDVDYVYDAVMGRMEWLALQAMSLTKLQLTYQNNPMGIVNEVAVDFLMPAANKKTVAVVWSAGNAAIMTPIADFKAVAKAARGKGIYFEKVLMHPDTYDLITGCTEFQTAAKSLLVGESQLLGLMSLDVTNKILTALRLPNIALVETSIGIEGKSGVYSESSPWDTNHVLFIPSTTLGSYYNGPIAEEIEKADATFQSKRGNVLISIHKSFNPISILTKGESNCFPSWPTIDRCFSLYINSTSVWA